MAITGSVRAIGSGQVFFSTSCRNVLQVCVRCGRGEGRRVGGWEESAAVHLVHVHVHVLGLHVH